MNELIQNIVQRTGIPQDKAQTVVQMVISHLKGRMPAPIASQLDNYIGGQEGQGQQGGGISGALGGMMGGNKTDAA